MIKKFEAFNELDPYGEEDWDDENQFKIGDEVICINDRGGVFLTFGKSYKILDLHPYDYIGTINDRGESNTYNSIRFKKKTI